MHVQGCLWTFRRDKEARQLSGCIKVSVFGVHRCLISWLPTKDFTHLNMAVSGFPTRKAIRPFAQRYKLLLRGACAGAVIVDMTDEVCSLSFCLAVRLL